MMIKAILQKQITRDILTAALSGPHAIIKTECCIYIPDNSANMSQDY